MNSIWKLASIKNDSLKNDLNTNIAIVGGGISGILCAYKLSFSHNDISLFEADHLYSKTTSHTTAHISALQGCLYSKLSRLYSNEYAKMYFDSQIEAINEYQEIITKNNIDCDFRILDDHLYNIDYQSIKDEFDCLKNFTNKVSYEKNKKIFGKFAKEVITLKNQASFHPLKFLNSLKKDFSIYENTKIIDIDFENKILFTKDYKIKANIIIVATNFPIIDIPGFYFLKMYKSASNVIVLKDGGNINGLYQENRSDGKTFRNYHNDIIISCLDYRCLSKKDITAFDNLKKNITKDIIYEWNANDCITDDSLPYIGPYTKKYKDIYVITGFNKWGMTNAMIASSVICDLIDGKHNKYETLFSPQRKQKSLLFHINNNLHIIKDYGKTLFYLPLFKTKNIAPNCAKIVFYKGKKVAVYRDQNSRLHFCKAYCSHLKCLLTFNSLELTWDCPCHGSRYDIDGNIISTPTTKKITLT